MKHTLTSCLLALAIGVTGCGQEAEKPTDLPWQITLSAAGNPQVFHVEVGVTPLKALNEHLHNFPDIAVFSHESGKRTLEAYYGTQRMGLFEAKIIAELQADPATLDKFQAGAIKHEGMASGQWKFSLSEPAILQSNDLPIEKLVYMPAVNYEPEIVNARFGIPAERLPAAKAGVEFWCYPDKGLIIALNNDGGDILYYVAKSGFVALKQTLLEEKPKNG